MHSSPIPQSIPGLIAALPLEEVVTDAVARAMDAEMPLSNLYFKDGIDPVAFGEMLAAHLRASAGSAVVSRAAVDLRASYAFRAEHDAGVRIWHGGDDSPWTVIFEESPLFATPPAPWTLFLKRWPEEPKEAFRFVALELPGILVFPVDLEAPIAGVPVLPMVGAR